MTYFFRYVFFFASYLIFLSTIDAADDNGSTPAPSIKLPFTLDFTNFDLSQATLGPTSPAPVISETSAPITETSAPITETSAPTIETPAPITATTPPSPAPIIATTPNPTTIQPVSTTLSEREPIDTETIQLQSTLSEIGSLECDLDEPIQIGERHSICIVLGNNANWKSEVEYLQYAFQPKADQYSKFHIDQSYKDLIVDKGLVEGNQNLTYFFGVNESVSFVRMYYEPKKGDSYEDDDQHRIYPIITAIIDVKKGMVQGLDYDNSCEFCPKDKCADNTYTFDGKNPKSMRKGCYLTRKECNDLAEIGDTTCDLKFYFVWTGTEIDGKSFQSSQYRFSAFPPSSIMNQFKNFFSSK